MNKIIWFDLKKSSVIFMINSFKTVCTYFHIKILTLFTRTDKIEFLCARKSQELNTRQNTSNKIMKEHKVLFIGISNRISKN
ncbi:hypothetical protein BpHYR1_030086 [Brachionus plicatilis]|uniref:Uncharacterized protein n=1 Tax=Brachionus plicatilis TaxID=10195 RepID=A0A3M7PGM9_BRAPC|nr:hypothetical protein BpHYR1_030086 [Brachionus plicatilis]